MLLDGSLNFGCEWQNSNQNLLFSILGLYASMLVNYTSNFEILIKYKHYLNSITIVKTYNKL